VVDSGKYIIINIRLILLVNL